MANQFTTSAPPNLTIEQITDGLLFGDRFWNPSDFTFSIPGAGASWTGYTAGHEQASADYGVLTLAQADQFRAAVAQWDKLIAPNFTETNDATSPGNIRAAFSEYGSNSNDGVWGYAYAPPVGGGSSVLSGDIWIGAEVKGSTFAEGSYDFMALLHELGHAIGMKHSFEAPKIPKAYDNHRFTVMSYTDQKDLYWVNFTHPDASHIQANFTDVNASTPMVLDIAAIQELYGADATTGAGNTVYHFSEDDPFMLAIYDAGGKDTFDLSGLARGSEVDLRSGAYSSVGYYSAADQKADAKAANPGFSASFFDSVYSSVTPYTWSDNVGIAFSTVIENATGGSGDDSLLGNSAKNSLKGGGGGDTLSGGGKGDILIGGSGKDIFLFQKLADSAASRPDLIKDLAATDKIDLHLIDADSTADGNQAFIIVANHTGPGQGVFSYDAGDDLTTLRLFTNGDNAPDMVITMSGDQTGFNNFVL